VRHGVESVCLDKADVVIEGAKARFLSGLFGTAEAVPLRTAQKSAFMR
jgi:hypothetical protein